MTSNPFLGSQPYGAEDGYRFFGRAELAHQLCEAILANHRVIVQGPAGAGKSSLLQVAVLPVVAEEHDTRIIRVEEWPEEEEPTARLASVMRAEFGISDIAADEMAKEFVVKTVRSAARTSPRSILIYLDQLEQIFFRNRSAEALQQFFACIEELFDLSFQTLRFVLVLREDSLSSFWNGLRGGPRTGEHEFRVRPLPVSEAVQVVEQMLSVGDPPQEWSVDEIHALMLQVRMPGQAASDNAEVQLAHAQIICRMLFEERAAGKTIEVVDAEPMLRTYLETTLSELDSLRPKADALLEAHVVRTDGSRTLRSEKELSELVDDPQELDFLLKQLESAAILQAHVHQGKRYFEAAHEGFARYIFIKRQARERTEKHERERTESRKRQIKERRGRRRMRALVAASIVFAMGAAVLGIWGRKEHKKAEEATAMAQAAEALAKQAEAEATAKAIEASDARLIVGFRELRNRGRVASGMKLLHEVQQPKLARDWMALANEALETNVLEVTLRAAESAVSMAAWSPDGRRIAAGAADGTVWTWRVTGDGAPSRMAIHEQRVVSIAWSPDGKRLITASEDGTARLVDVDGNNKPIVFDPKAGPLRQAIFSPDGTRIAVIGTDTVARVWNVDGSGPLEIRGHLSELTSVSFMPNGQSLLTSSTDQSALITAVDGSGKRVVLRGHQGAVRFAAASPDGSFVVTVSDDRTVRVAPASGTGTQVLLEGHGDAVIHAAWSPDGTRIATTSLDKTVRNWAADGKGETVVLTAEGRALASASFRKDGRYILTRSLDRTIAVWPASGGKPLRIEAHDGPVVSAAWSPDGKRAMSAAGGLHARSTTDSTVKVWRLESLEALPRTRKPYFHSASILADGRRAVAAFDDRTALLFQLNGEGEQIRFSGHEGWLSGAFASQNGSLVLTTSFDKTARVWNADGKGEPVVLRGSESAIRAGAFSPDGKRVVTVSDDKKLRIWKADDGSLERELSGHTDLITSVTWSPDGVFVLTTSLDRTAGVWRPDGSRQPVLLKGHMGGIVTAAWASDSARVVTASEDHTAGVWNAATGQLLSSLEHASPVLAVAWSPDDKRVVTSSVQHGLRVWKADGTEDPLELPVESPVLAVMFLDDGRRIVAISENDTIRTFIIDIDMLMSNIEAANRDCLLPQERVTYLGETPETAATLHEACERLAKKLPVVTEGR
jgi:WD40 repeat protein